MGTLSTQTPCNVPQGIPHNLYLQLQNSLDSLTVPSQTTTASFESSVRIAPSVPSQPHHIKSFGFTDLCSSMERRQWDGFISHWSHAAVYEAPYHPPGVSSQRVFPTTSSFREHSHSRLYPWLKSSHLAGIKFHRSITVMAVANMISNPLNRSLSA